MADKVMEVAFSTVVNFIKLVQGRGENKASAAFLSNRLEVLWQCLSQLKNNSNTTVAAIENVTSQIRTAYELCEVIFSRGTFMNLWKNSSDKAELIEIGDKLDACIGDLDIALNVDQQRLLAEAKTSIQEVSDKIDQLLQLRSGNAEYVRKIITEERAFEFYQKWFNDNTIITIQFFLAGLTAELRENRGIEASPGLRQVITNAVDQNGDGVVDIHELNEFFRDQWIGSQIDDLLLEGEEAQDIVDSFGPQYGRPAQLTVEKCNEPTTFQPLQHFRLLPEGFQDIQGCRIHDRTTLIGTLDSGFQQNDIILAANDPYCSKQQAVINHTSVGYKLTEIAINGLIRIAVQEKEEVEMVKGTTISFGLSNICRVVNVFDAGGQTEIKSNGTVQNLYSQNAPLAELDNAFDEEQECTIAISAFEVKPCVLEVEFISGPKSGETIQCSSQKGNYSIGRLGSKDIRIMAGDVSGDHGCFYFDAQKWYYKHGEKPPTNGTWKGVSNFDQYSQGKQSDGVLLRDNDLILIGQQHLRFKLD